MWSPSYFPNSYFPELYFEKAAGKTKQGSASQAAGDRELYLYFLAQEMEMYHKFMSQRRDSLTKLVRQKEIVEKVNFLAEEKHHRQQMTNAAVALVLSEG